jgi:hypothetical protein
MKMLPIMPLAALMDVPSCRSVGGPKDCDPFFCQVVRVVYGNWERCDLIHYLHHAAPVVCWCVGRPKHRARGCERGSARLLSDRERARPPFRGGGIRVIRSCATRATARTMSSRAMFGR